MQIQHHNKKMYAGTAPSNGVIRDEFIATSKPKYKKYHI